MRTNKKLVTILLVLFISFGFLSIIQHSNASIFVNYGYCSSLGVVNVSPINQYEVNYITSLNPLHTNNDYVYLSSLSINIAYSISANIKILVINDDNGTVYVSQPFYVSYTGWNTLTLSIGDRPRLTNNTKYAIGIITDSQFFFYDSNDPTTNTTYGINGYSAINSNPTKSYLYTNNTVFHPTTTGMIAMYATTLEYNYTSPTPTPTPTATPIPIVGSNQTLNITYSQLNSGSYTANFTNTITGDYNFTITVHGLDANWYLYTSLEDGFTNADFFAVIKTNDFYDNGGGTSNIGLQGVNIYSDYPINNSAVVFGDSISSIFGVYNLYQHGNILTCSNRNYVVPNTYFWNSFVIDNDGSPFTQGYITVTMQQLTSLPVLTQATYSYSINPTPNYTVYNSLTSAHINQAQNYVYTGIVTSATEPYGVGSYNVYVTPLIEGNLNDNILRDSMLSSFGLLGTEQLTLNKTGTFNLNGNGQFNFNILQSYLYNSICTYQGFKINGTITGTGETFTSYIAIEAVEPLTSQIIQVYLNGGMLTNYQLTEIGFNQLAFNTQYNASGYVFNNGVPYSGSTINITSTSIVNDQISVKNLPFSNNIALNLVNGTFTFLITPQIYSAFPLYQGIKIYQQTLGVSVTYYIEFIGLGTTVFPTPYPTSSNSIVLTPTSSIDLTQWFMMFFLVFVPPLILAGMCYEEKDKTSINISPILGFFFGVCIMVPIGYLTPYNGAPLIPLWMLFCYVMALIVFGVLLFKNMFFHGEVH